MTFLFFALVGKLTAQTDEIAIVYIQNGDGGDSGRWTATQAMVNSLNQHSGSHVHYTAYTEKYFSALTYPTYTAAHETFVLTEGGFNQQGKFNGTLSESSHPGGDGRPQSVIVADVQPKRFGLVYMYCGMDGDNRILNVDDFGNRIAEMTGGDYRIVGIGPLSPLSPNFFNWLSGKVYSTWGHINSSYSPSVYATAAFLDNFMHQFPTPSYYREVVTWGPIRSCEFINE
jgi:hypothetical protein